MGQEMNSTEPKIDHSHALCLSRSEVVLLAVIFAVGVGLSTLHELMFGDKGAHGVVMTVIFATQGSLFWSALLIGLLRLGIGAYRRMRRSMMQPRG